MDDWLVPEIDAALCSKCGLCADSCPGHAVVMTEQGASVGEARACTYCGVCETECPEGAISLSYVIVWETDGPNQREETEEDWGGGTSDRSN